ncbi:MAG: transcription termination factor NusA [bacterium]
MGRELIQVIRQVSREKKVDERVLIEAIETALLSASRKHFAVDEKIAAHLNQKDGELELFKVFEVVENITNKNNQITLDKALSIDPNAKIGEAVEVKVEMHDLGRIAARAAKHVIIQKVKEAEREMIYNEFIGKKGNLINGVVSYIDKDNVVIELGKTEVTLSAKGQVIGETFKLGEHIRAYIVDVVRTNKGPQVVLSRNNVEFVIKLFEKEVPEISEGIVQIKAAAREPGERTKIAVYCPEEDIDPVGACVGMRGMRVQAIVNDLKGEKIDIIRWSDDPKKFVHNALAPAEVIKTEFDKESGTVAIEVLEEHLSLAIGKKGQNARLASKLTGWNIDIKNESRRSETPEKTAAQIDDGEK